MLCIELTMCAQRCAAHAVLGKVEGEDKLWHGHVTAVTVASDCRRLGLATKLMNILEDTTECVYALACVALALPTDKRPRVAVIQGLYSAIRTAAARKSTALARSCHAVCEHLQQSMAVRVQA